VRSKGPPRFEPFVVEVPQDQPLEQTQHGEDMIVTLPAQVPQVLQSSKPTTITLPEGEELEKDETSRPGYILYHFPAKCTVHREPVNRWQLAIVVAQAVAAICLWGTLVGSMLPLIFRRLGVDPGIASSPFVATFVDVTGIIIYFTIATFYLLK